MRREQSVVIVPSRTIEKFHEPAAETQAYEERLLCLLLMLREPGLRVIYVTSTPVADANVEYYLSLLPAGLRDDARERLTTPRSPTSGPRAAAASCSRVPV